MKRFRKLEEYSDDDLIIVVMVEKQLWQKDAIIYAKHLLNRRGITEEYQEKRIQEIESEYEVLWQKELESRKTESYNLLDLILMTLLWFKYIFSDWYLYREGYHKKRKQRMVVIGIGFITCLFIFTKALLSADEIEQQRIDEITHLHHLDSLSKSMINWSGQYSFIDTNNNKSKKILWNLILHKNGLEHDGELFLIKEHDTLRICCIGLIKDSTVEFFPDTTYILVDRTEISYYDMLFSFQESEGLIYTKWGKMKPFYYSQQKKFEVFKKSNSM